ncbi:MAG: glucose-1-phosphate adenylyltransferase [Atopobiaceae bacterium]|jgi:glucose-1-phosphate adenylyltransferase|nr:glucose-1-phosphate adenylyltransferase [Atopobiaceae bacterium]
MSKKECVAMLLAGGQGSRLGVLTSKVAKPAVSFGGKYRIIDFVLSNCANSGINTVGVLTQYRPYLLHAYLGTGEAWNLDERNGGVAILPPYATQTGGSWYAGTADAITQNIGYLESQDAEYILILSGDQLYRMDYEDMLATHKANNADLTVAVMPVPWEDAPRFGIMNTREDGSIEEFVEKPAEPKSNLASMGIYIFTADLLINTLKEDAEDPNSSHDFGGDIIPKLLAAGKRLYTYQFKAYWRDVGTVASFHEANMELLGAEPAFDLFAQDAPIMSNSSTRPPAFIGLKGSVDDSLIDNGCTILGSVEHSVISSDVYVGKNAVVKDSILFPGARVEEGAVVINAIMAERAVVEAGATFGSADEETVTLGDDAVVKKGE